MANGDAGRTGNEGTVGGSDTTRRPGKSIEEAAAETREPERAARVRAEDDADTRARQAAAGDQLGDSARTLADNAQRLRETRDALRATGRDVSRTSAGVRDVAENAATLRAQTTEAAEMVRDVPVRGGGDARREPTDRDEAR